MRASTSILDNNVAQYLEIPTTTNMAIANQQCFVYLDSPATTSATTYKLQGAINTGTGIQFQKQSGTSTITLLEIGA